jgi:EAL domain-containing protein (putative c-di-GMP-specific phosphodiesterase class I)
MMEDRHEANRALRSFKEFGVSAALDDFGTGHSSLSYLNDLAVEEIKLDRSFLRNVLSDQKARLLVGSTIRTAHQLGLRVVAEGVEDGATLAFLRGEGCDFAQGFLIAKPMDSIALEDWLSRNAPWPG